MAVAAGQWAGHTLFFKLPCENSLYEMEAGSDVMYGLWYFSGIACEISLSAIAVSVGRFYYYTRH